jgi:hypothetical protein
MVLFLNVSEPIAAEMNEDRYLDGRHAIEEAMSKCSAHTYSNFLTCNYI